jgi:tetratricopeptide (TPR) repeat protein
MFFTRKRFPKKILSLAGAMFLLLSTLLYSYGAEKLGMGANKAELWGEIADIRIEAAKGHDLQSNIRKEAAFRARGSYDPSTPGDELDIAGDEKYLASEDYQSATKHWEKAARAFRTLVELNKARNAQENAVETWEAAKRTLREAIQIYRMAQEYYDATNNLEKKTAVLGKIARNLERLMEMKIRPIGPLSVYPSPPLPIEPNSNRTVGILSPLIVGQHPPAIVATMSLPKALISHFHAHA